MKDRLKKAEEECGIKDERMKSFSINEIILISKPTPFGPDGKRRGEWIDRYEFSEWYYDMDGNPVFISPGYEGDKVGDLYDQNSEFVGDLPMDKNGNYLPVILMTADYKFLEFKPNLELVLPPPNPQSSDYERKGNWIKEYKFSEWYFYKEGQPVFISPAFEGDKVGILYDRNSKIISGLPKNQQGDYLPVTLITTKNQLVEFIPSKLQHQTSSGKNTNLQSQPFEKVTGLKR